MSLCDIFPSRYRDFSPFGASWSAFSRSEIDRKSRSGGPAGEMTKQLSYGCQNEAYHAHEDSLFGYCPECKLSRSLTWLPWGSDCWPSMFWYGSLYHRHTCILPTLFADVQAFELTDGLQEGVFLESLEKDIMYCYGSQSLTRRERQSFAHFHNAGN